MKDSDLGGQPTVMPLNKCQWLVCCDCGLTHMRYFHLKRKKGKLVVEETMFRDDYDTVKVRKREKIEVRKYK